MPGPHNAAKKKHHGWLSTAEEPAPDLIRGLVSRFLQLDDVEKETHRDQGML